MNTSKHDMMKYVGAAAAIGGTMLIGSGILSSNKSVKKKMKKTANKALDAVDGILNGVSGLMK